MRALFLPILFLWMIVITGCPASTPGPRETLNRYVEAASSGDCDGVYELMSSEYREEHSQADFCQSMGDNPAEFREALESLRSASGDPEITARLRYGLGDELAFLFEDGQWRIDSPVLDFYSQTTPRETLRSFVRALERRRYDIIIQFVPARYRERMSVEQIRDLWEGESREEIQQLLENLRDSLDEPIEEVGNHATMEYMEHYTCRFLREGGLWRIEDPD